MERAWTLLRGLEGATEEKICGFQCGGHLQGIFGVVGPMNWILWLPGYGVLRTGKPRGGDALRQTYCRIRCGTMLDCSGG